MNNGQKLNFAVYTKQLSQFDSYLQSNDVLKESGTLVFLTQDKSLYLDGVFYGSGTDPNSHTHDNIAILDNITSNDINAWNDAATNTHIHSNKSVLDGITSSDITNWNNKVDINHTHSYAGSSSTGGAATSANKLNTDAGNANNPVYFSNGVPVATTYQLNKTVPSDAVFTDHTYNFAGTSFTSGANGVAEHNADNITSNGNWYYTSNGPSTSIGASSTDGALYSQFHSTNWGSQIAQDYRNGNLFVRGKNNGAFTPWVKMSTPSDVKNIIDPIEQIIGAKLAPNISLSSALMTTETNPEVLSVCYAQGWCSSPTQMTYAEALAVTDIGTVFQGNTSITHFEELQWFGITEITDYAFDGCTNLTRYGISPTVTYMGDQCLRNTNIREVYIRDLRDFLQISRPSYRNAGPGYRWSYLYLNNQKITNITIPDNTYLNTQAFYLIYLDRVVVPKSLTYINYQGLQSASAKNIDIEMTIEEWCEAPLGHGYATFNVNQNITFAGVPAVGRITLKSGLSIIRWYSLSIMSKLTELIIPDTVTTIQPITLYDLQKLTIGNGVTSMDGYAHNFPNLKEIKIYAKTPPDIDYRGTFGNVDTPNKIIYVPSNSTGYDSGAWAAILKLGQEGGWTLSKTLPAA